MYRYLLAFVLICSPLYAFPEDAERITFNGLPFGLQEGGTIFNSAEQSALSMSASAATRSIVELTRPASLDAPSPTCRQTKGLFGGAELDMEDWSGSIADDLRRSVQNRTYYRTLDTDDFLLIFRGNCFMGCSEFRVVLLVDKGSGSVYSSAEFAENFQRSIISFLDKNRVSVLENGNFARSDGAEIDPQTAREAGTVLFAVSESGDNKIRARLTERLTVSIRDVESLIDILENEGLSEDNSQDLVNLFIAIGIASSEEEAEDFLASLSGEQREAVQAVLQGILEFSLVSQTNYALVDLDEMITSSSEEAISNIRSNSSLTFIPRPLADPSSVLNFAFDQFRINNAQMGETLLWYAAALGDDEALYSLARRLNPERLPVPRTASRPNFCQIAGTWYAMQHLALNEHPEALLEMSYFWSTQNYYNIEPNTLLALDYALKAYSFSVPGSASQIESLHQFEIDAMNAARAEILAALERQEAVGATGSNDGRPLIVTALESDAARNIISGLAEGLASGLSEGAVSGALRYVLEN